MMSGNGTLANQMIYPEGTFYHEDYVYQASEL